SMDLVIYANWFTREWCRSPECALRLWAPIIGKPERVGFDAPEFNFSTWDTMLSAIQSRKLDGSTNRRRNDRTPLAPVAQPGVLVAMLVCGKQGVVGEPPLRISMRLRMLMASCR